VLHSADKAAVFHYLSKGLFTLIPGLFKTWV
jgi:hypothetical protein